MDAFPPSAWVSYFKGSGLQRCSTRTRTLTQLSKLVPVPEYPLWYPYPCFNMAWYPYSYPYPFHCTRTHTEVPVPVPVPVPIPIFQPSLVPVPTGWYLYGTVPTGWSLFWYPYPYLVPIPGIHTHKICEPKLLCFNYSGTPASALSYTLYSCLWVCKPISTMLRHYRHSCKVCWLLSLSEEKMFHMKSIDDVPVSLTKIKSYQIPNYRFDFLQIANQASCCTCWPLEVVSLLTKLTKYTLCKLF